MHDGLLLVLVRVSLKMRPRGGGSQGRTEATRHTPKATMWAHSDAMCQREREREAIDAAAAAIPAPHPGRRVPLDLAYHPKGLPPAAALPSLTQMADPECKTNLRAQRSFAQVSQLGSWLELTDGERGGGGSTARCAARRWRCASARGSSAWRSRRRARGCRPSRGPTSSGCARRCTKYVTVQRWLGLPIHMASAANVIPDDRRMG